MKVRFIWDATIKNADVLLVEIEKVKKAQVEAQLDTQGNVHVTEKIMINLEDHKQVTWSHDLSLPTCKIYRNCSIYSTTLLEDCWALRVLH